MKAQIILMVELSQGMSEQAQNKPGSAQIRNVLTGLSAKAIREMRGISDVTDCRVELIV